MLFEESEEFGISEGLELSLEGLYQSKLSTNRQKLKVPISAGVNWCPPWKIILGRPDI